MNDLAITALLVGALFAILGSGVWIGLSLTGVAWLAMELFSSRPAGDAMAMTHAIQRMLDDRRWATTSPVRPPRTAGRSLRSIRGRRTLALRSASRMRPMRKK